MTLILGPNTAFTRTRNVVFVEPTWGDDPAVTWLADTSPVAGAPLTNLFTRQPVQVAAWDVSAESLALQGQRATAAPLDVVAIPYATATPAATWHIQCGDSGNEAVGLRAHDASGNGRDADRHGATSFDAGKYGSGLRLGNEDHADDYLETVTPITVPEFGTYMGWFNPSVLGETRALFSHGDNGTDRLCGIVLADGRVQAGIDTDAVTAAPVLVPGSWTHLAFVWNGTDRPRLYVDGELAVSFDNAPSFTGASHTLIWGASDVESFGFAGVMDDLRYYEANLDEAQIQAEMASETPTVSNLVVHYKLNGYDSGLVTFGAAPNAPFKGNFQRRLGWHMLPYRLDCKVVRLTINDPTNTAALRIGRLFIGPAEQPEKNFDYGWRVGHIDDTRKSYTPTGQTTTNSRVPRPYVEFQIRHLTRAAIMAHLYALERDYGTSQPFLVCADPEDDQSLQMLTVYGTAAELNGFPEQYHEGWESVWRVEAML